MQWIFKAMFRCFESGHPFSFATAPPVLSCTCSQGPVFTLSNSFANHILVLFLSIEPQPLNPAYSILLSLGSSLLLHNVYFILPPLLGLGSGTSTLGSLLSSCYLLKTVYDASLPGLPNISSLLIEPPRHLLLAWTVHMSWVLAVWQGTVPWALHSWPHMIFIRILWGR